MKGLLLQATLPAVEGWRSCGPIVQISFIICLVLVDLYVDIHIHICLFYFAMEWERPAENWDFFDLRLALLVLPILWEFHVAEVGMPLDQLGDVLFLLGLLMKGIMGTRFLTNSDLLREGYLICACAKKNIATVSYECDACSDQLWPAKGRVSHICTHWIYIANVLFKCDECSMCAMLYVFCFGVVCPEISALFFFSLFSESTVPNPQPHHPLPRHPFPFSVCLLLFFFLG